MRIHLKTQLDIRKDIEQGTLRDTSAGSGKKWSTREILLAINYGIREISGRVLVPHVWEPGTQFGVSSYTYELPSYVTKYARPQYLPSVWDYSPTGVNPTGGWVDMDEWVMEESTTGNAIRLSCIPRHTEWRIIYWAPVEELPLDAVTLGDDLDAGGSSMTITTTEADRVPPTGYVKINAEWIRYASKASGASSVTLSRLRRGENWTTDSAHTSGDTVYFGVPATDPVVYDVIQNYAISRLYEISSVTTTTEEEYHRRERARRLSLQRADEKLASLRPSWQPRLRVNYKTGGRGT